MTLPRVASCMEHETHSVRSRDDLYDVVQMLIDRSVTGAPVVDDEGKVVGMITEAECLKLLSEGSDGVAPGGTVGEFMKDAITVRPDMNIYHVAGLFNTHPSCRRFAVVADDNELIAVVTRKDILKLVRRELMRGTAGATRSN